MTVLDIFWIFFMLSALQPVIRQRMLDAMRMRKIAQLERERNSRVILLVHRQETMKLLGFPVMRYIDVNDSEEVLRAIQMTDDDVPLDIVLHTPGGLVLAALQIARAIRGHKAKVTVLRTALRDVGRNPDCAGRRRDRDVTACGSRSDRPSARAVSGRFVAQGGRAETDLRDRRQDVDPRRCRTQGDRPGQGRGQEAARPAPSGRAGRDLGGEAVRPGPGRTTTRSLRRRRESSVCRSAPRSRTGCSS